MLFYINKKHMRGKWAEYGKRDDTEGSANIAFAIPMGYKTSLIYVNIVEIISFKWFSIIAENNLAFWFKRETWQ